MKKLIYLILLLSASAFAGYNADNIEVDLDAFKIANNVANGELLDVDEEIDEIAEGAFVPINDDDDDYTAISPGDDGIDKDQQTSTPNETDLLPFILHKVGPDPIPDSIYTLTIPAHVKIWTANDRTGVIISDTTQFDANIDTTVYVEGHSKASNDIKINWTENPNANAAEKNYIADLDRVTVTVFKWVGPLNVPGYSSHLYTASGALAESKWANLHGSGTIISNTDGDADPSNEGLDDDSALILWGGGPSIGEATYNVNENYTWILEVNVVSVTMTFVENDILYQNFPYQNIEDGNSFVIGSIEDDNEGLPEVAVNAQLTVSKIEGPIRGGLPRGVKFLEFGMCQNLKATSWNSLFSGGLPHIERTCKFEDKKYHLDQAPSSTTKPWYSDLQLWTNQSVGYFKPNSDNDVLNKRFVMIDAPQAIVKSDFIYSRNGNLDIVDQFNIVWDFNTYFCVRTIDIRNDANDKYTKRAEASWQFNGTGTTIGIVPVWSPIANVTKNSGSNKFTEVNDGSTFENSGDTQTILQKLLATPANQLWTDYQLP